MKKAISFLFTRHPKIGGTAPIYLVVLGVVVIFALYYFLVMNKDESTPTTSSQSEVSSDSNEESFFSKLAFWKKDDENSSPEQITEADRSFTPHQIPADVLEVDENLISEKEEPVFEEVEGKEENIFDDFKAEEVQIKDVGRRDPMRTIVGENVGTLDLNRADYEAADLKDESLNYFGGVSIEEIVLDYISVDELGDSKARADFIINGSYVPNLEVGDYLLELYYVKKIDTVKKEVHLSFQDKIFVLSEENVYFKEVKYDESSNKSSGSNSGKESGNNSK